MPHKKRRLGQTHTSGRSREDREKTATYKPRKEALQETNPDDALISDFSPPEP